MENQLEVIRAALSEDATEEVRRAGAEACRGILARLESAPDPESQVQGPAVGSTIATVAGTLRSVPIDQLLDLAIVRLQAALPAGAEVPTVPPLRLPLVAVPRR